MKCKLNMLLALVFVALAAPAFAQYDGDMLGTYLGKTSESQEVTSLRTNYKCEMANPAHCLSKDGIELILKNNQVSEIHLYKNSPVYGSFKGKLPKGLSFGMSSGTVKSVLGKPSVAYNTGYCEFEIQNYIVSCWFESGVLAQVGLSLKS